MNTSEDIDPSLSLADPLLQPLPSAQEPVSFSQEGETFQHYQVLRRPDGSLWELGRGAMGVTYKAFDTNLRCYVALKVISGQHLHSEMAGQRFIREARVAARLRHPNIASVYHLGVDPQGFFYSMEFIDGETLEDFVLRVGPLPPETVLRVALQTARALAAASRQGLIHRDIKPANLMVLHQDEEGEDRLLVKVIDFGLARSYDPGDSSPQLTATGFVGTPLYASPEQLEEKVLDVRSDIYSLGVTLWILLTGRPPFEGKMTQVITHHLHSEPPWRNLEGCPEPIRFLLERMLSKDPVDRFQTAGELRVAVENCLRSMVGTSDLFTGETDAGVPGGPSPSFVAARSEMAQMASATPTLAETQVRQFPATVAEMAKAMPPATRIAAGQSRFEPVGRLARERPKPFWFSVAGVATVLCVGSILLWPRSVDSANARRQEKVSRPVPAPAPAVASMATVPVVASVAAAPVAAETPPPTPPPLAVAPVPEPTVAPHSSPTNAEVRRDEPWGALVSGDSLPAAPVVPTPGESETPVGVAMVPPSTVQESPGATASATADDNSDEDDDSDKPAASKGKAKSSRSTRTRRKAKVAPTPAPNFFQKIFGIKPKPQPKTKAKR